MLSIKSTHRRSRPYLASVSAISVIISFLSDRRFRQRLQMLSFKSDNSCSQSGHRPTVSEPRIKIKIDNQGKPYKSDESSSRSFKKNL